MIDLARSEPDTLPSALNLSMPELSYDVWALWMATGRRFLPSQLLAEPTAMLNDVLQLDALYESVKRLEEPQWLK